MPIVQIILFGFAITNEVHEAKLAILDQSKDYYSQQLIQKLEHSEYFQVYQLISSPSEVQPAFEAGEIKMAIVIPPDFAHTFYHENNAAVQLITDATDPNIATTLQNYASAILLDFQDEMFPLDHLPLTIHAEQRMVFNPALKSVYMFVPGVMTLILMLVSAMMTSIAITREKELGTMEILLVSPIKPVMIITGKVVPYIVLSFINAIIILILSVTIFGMPIKGSLILLLAECGLFVMVALSLGILISSITDSQQTAMMVSMVGLMMPTMLLSGFVFPLESMPMPLRIVANLLPAKWFIIILKSIMLKGGGLKDVWLPTTVLIGMSCFLLLISIRKFKTRLS